MPNAKNTATPIPINSAQILSNWIAHHPETAMIPTDDIAIDRYFIMLLFGLVFSVSDNFNRQCITIFKA